MLTIVVASPISSSRSSNGMYHDLVIQVSERKGRTIKHACMTAPDSFCQSLEFIATYLQNYSRNVTILLDSKTLLPNEIIFNNSEIHFLSSVLA
jgi:hypothetical protein